MKILGIDSSGLVASVAVTEDDNLLGEFTMNYKKTHSQTLLPMLDELAKMIELDLNTIDAIAVSGGLIYRTPHRFRNSERTWAGTGKTAYPHTYRGRACL